MVDVGRHRTQTFAQRALKARLIVLNGAEQGYSKWVEDEVEKATGRRFGRGYLNGIVSGRMPASVPMQLALIRLVEQNTELTNTQAAALAPAWFEEREVGKR